MEIPTLDDGNQAMIGDLRNRIETGNFDDFDPDHFMLEANRQFGSTFTPQFRQFVDAEPAMGRGRGDAVPVFKPPSSPL